MPLARERCQACTGSTPTVAEPELSALRAELHPDWRVEDAWLRRRVTVADFATAFTAATRIALLAEAEGHHPDLGIGWGRLDIALTTHAVRGLTRNDLILAAKIDRLL